MADVMLKPFLLVIAAGAGVGLMLPAGRTPAPLAAAAAVEPGGAPAETVLEREENGHFFVDAEVNGELVHFLVDTGATSVALTQKDARRIGIDFSPGEFEVVGTGASGPVRGERVTLDSVEVEGKRVVELDGVVLEGLEISLLGQSYLSQIGGVQMNGDIMSLR